MSAVSGDDDDENDVETLYCLAANFNPANSSDSLQVYTKKSSNISLLFQPYVF